MFGGNTPKVIPEFTGLQVNTAVQVLPVPILYGSPRVTINLIYYNGFNVQQVKVGGGKGVLGGGKSGNKQTEYFATFIAAIGEGPIGNPLIIYQDQSIWTPSTYPSNGASYFNGTAVQAPWSYVTANWPSDARSYKNTAYYAFANAQIDSSATIPQINLVVEGFFKGSSPLNNSTITISTGQYDSSGKPLSFIGAIPIGFADADPAEVIYDFLSDPTHGATFPVEWIDTNTLFTSANGYDPNTGDTALSTFCQAVGLAWSLAIDNVESAGSILDRLCTNLNVAVVWNGALLRFIPYWDQYASANPGWSSLPSIPKKYFTPYTTPIISVPLNQILQSDQKDEDPITFARKDPLEVYNTVRIDFKDRNNFWNDVPAEAKDEAHIELYGPRVDNIGLAKEYTLSDYAAIVANMKLRRNISIMRTYNFRLGPLWGWLDPMDILAIPDPTNYNNTILVRVTDVEDDEDEVVTVTAEEYPIGTQSPSTLPLSSTTPPNQGAVNSPPLSVYTPVIFEPTTAMLTATGFALPQIVTGVSAGSGGTLDTNYGGCVVWISLNSVDYQTLGTIVGPSTIGVLAAPLAAYGGANPDNVHSISVNLNESDGTLASFPSSAAAAGNSICIVQDGSGFEIFSYTTATLTGPFTYALTGVYRGLYGTTPRYFGAGSRFLYLGAGGNFLEADVPSAYVGMTFWAKFQAFNVFNQAAQDLESLVAYQYVVTGPTPQPPVPVPSISGKERRGYTPMASPIGGRDGRRVGRKGYGVG